MSGLYAGWLGVLTPHGLQQRLPGLPDGVRREPRKYKPAA